MKAMKLRASGATILAAVSLAAAVAVAALLAVVDPVKSQTAPTTFTVDRGDDRTPGMWSCTDAPNPDCTLRDAVFRANAVTTGEVTIEFAGDVDEVVLSVAGDNEDLSQTGDLDIRRLVTIDGGQGEDRVTVSTTSGENISEPFDDRVFEIFTPAGLTPGVDEGSGANIDSLVIRDGVTEGTPATTATGDDLFGAGIFVDEWATLDLTNSTVRNNDASTAGGGIYLANPLQQKEVTNPGGEATITDSQIIENEAGLTDRGDGQPAGGGGGVAALQDSTLNLTDSIVSDNFSNNLSAGVIAGGVTNITRTTISDNTAVGLVGGIGVGSIDGTDPDTELTMQASTVSGNTANAAGGMGIVDAPALIFNSTISGNTASGSPSQQNPIGGSGGGMGVIGGDADVDLESVTIAENAANSGGGGIATDNGALSDTDNPDAVTATNTIVADNTPMQGGQCFSLASVTPPVASNGFNLEFPGDSCGFETTGEDPLLVELDANGGPTFTHALPKNSPAVDQGNTDLARDQRGERRPSDFPGIANSPDGDRSGSDIGAFELQVPEPPNEPNKPNKPKPKNPNRCTIVGTPGGDILRGTPRRDVICGLGGNDIIRGFGGNDLLRGGAGNDAIYGGSGNDVLLGGPGRDILRGDGGRDRLVGGPGRDSVKQ